MKIKIECSCGVKSEFNEEPVNGMMPRALYCPNCDLELTEYANQYIAAVLAQTAPEAPAPAEPTPAAEAAAAPSGGGLRLSGHSAPAAPAPAEAAPAAPKSGGLRLSSGAGSSAPASPAPAAPAASASGPSSGSGGGGLKLSGSSKPEPAPAGGAAPAPEVEDLAAMVAKSREKELASVKKKRNADQAQYKKFMMLATIGCAIAVALLGVYFWYYLVGRMPKVYAVATLPNGQAYSSLVGADELLISDADGVRLFNLAENKDTWATPLSGPMFDFRYTDQEPLHITDSDVWVLRGDQLHQVSLATGEKKVSATIEGRVTSMKASGGMLVVTSEVGDSTRVSITKVDMGSGEISKEMVRTQGRKITRAEANSAGIEPTISNLTAQEVMVGEMSLVVNQDLFYPAGDSIAYVNVLLKEPKVDYIDAMKPAGGESVFNSKTSASANLGVAVGEIMNEIKRANGGNLIQVNNSEYLVTIRRMPAGETGIWQEKLLGDTIFHPLDTVDLLMDRKNLWILNKKNELVKKMPLTPTAQDAVVGDSPGVEANGNLYFFDRGNLTAMSLPKCEPIWRYQAVDIDDLAVDRHGDIYFMASTAPVESLNYPEQEYVGVKDLLVKLDGKTGKKKWEQMNTGQRFWAEGDFLYANKVAGNSVLSMATSADTDRSIYYRLKPSNGKKIWDFKAEGEVERADFFENRIMFQYQSQVIVLKYMTF